MLERRWIPESGLIQRRDDRHVRHPMLRIISEIDGGSFVRMNASVSSASANGVPVGASRRSTTCLPNFPSLIADGSRKPSDQMPWPALDEKLDVLDDLTGECPDGLAARPGNVRRQDEIRIGEQAREEMVGRRRLDRGHIEAGA